MSNEVSNAPAPSPVESGKESVGEAKPLSLDQISAEDAKALVAEAKSKGVSVQDLMSQKQASNPKQQSSKESVAEAAKIASRKLKIDDQEIDEDEVVRIYKERKKHQSVASRELNEGKAARKQAEDFISMMKDPGKFYETAKKLGHDPRKLAEEYLASQLQDELMDPRDKELRDAKSRLKQIEDMERKQKEAVEYKRNEELKAKYAQDFETQFVSALKETGLPANKGTVASMAKYISRSAKIGFEMTAQEAAQLVKEDIAAAHRSLIGDSDGETLIKLLGEDVANKVRKWDTSRIKNPESDLKTPEKSFQERRERDRGAPKKRMTNAEWRAFNRKK